MYRLYINSLARAAGVAALIAVTSTTSHAIFNINLTFTGSPTASQINAFTTAEAFWESRISGYITPLASTTLLSLNITANISAIDGPGGILGSAGPTLGFNDGTYFIAAAGTMRFDSADVANLEAQDQFNNVILHEMAHVMGLGTLWELNNKPANPVYINNSGQYTGAFGLAAYRAEFNQPLATFIPVELNGGSGTANGHWNDSTNVFDAQGRPLIRELMTGFINDGPANVPLYVADFTIQSFRDIGYTVAPVVVPETSTLILCSTGLLGFVAVRRTRTRTGRRTK